MAVVAVAATTAQVEPQQAAPVVAADFTERVALLIRLPAQSLMQRAVAAAVVLVALVEQEERVVPPLRVPAVEEAAVASSAQVAQAVPLKPVAREAL